MTGPTLLFTERGKLEARSTATLDDLLGALAAADEAKLLFFAHGGLVSEAHAVDTATRLDSGFDSIGYGTLKADGWALAYLIWHSDLAEVVESHRDELSRQGLFVRIVLRVLAWAERHIAGAESVLSLASDDLPTAMDALDPARERRGDDLADALEPDMATKALNADALLEEQLEQSDLAAILAADPELGALAEAELPSVDGEIRERVAAAAALRADARSPLAALGPAGHIVALEAIRAGFRVVGRFLHHRDHGLGPTVVEELCRALWLDKVGATAWGFMKNDAVAHFDRGNAGALLLDGIAQIAAHKPVRILVVGHSAGSIIATHLALAAATLPKNVSVDCIMLAPAMRLDAAASLLTSGGARLDHYRCFTMHDALEAANHLDGTAFGKVYQRSLPYLISGVLEVRGRKSYADAPLIGLERHIQALPVGKYDASEKVAHAAFRTFLGAAPARSVFSETPAPEGHATMSHLHGGYWADMKTLESIRFIARNGFDA